ncbi:MAG TPA: SRPBCC domain-containing protein [Candidatus Dormibacteraeota bacterium]|nr:SRPBCC domain-containing protein [Candidatus Dormibacteraeota bacterium]
MNPQPQKAIVQVTRKFTASAERVFDAWLDPNTVGKWLFATPTGKMSKVKIDARAGGSYVIVENRDGAGVEHIGEYLEIDRPRRLVFTLKVPKYSEEITKVTIEIRALGTGCELTLTHEGVLPAYIASTTSGWSMILEQLSATL